MKGSSFPLMPTTLRIAERVEQQPAAQVHFRLMQLLGWLFWCVIFIKLNKFKN